MLAVIALAPRLLAQEAMVAEGFDHFYNLEYDQAIADFETAIARNPASPDLHNHLAQTIVFREMYRNGALESELVSGAWMRSTRPWRFPRRASRRAPTTPAPCTRWASPMGCARTISGW